MRRIVLAALLAAVALPAWAANVFDQFDTPPIKSSDVDAFCLNAPTDNVGVCYLRHLSEPEAFRHAGNLLKICKHVDSNGPYGGYTVKDCKEYRAYIKQRWGY